MIKEIEAKSILIRSKDPSFFGMHNYINIYRGCPHGCIYCDTRSECYRIDNFDRDIEVKINAPELLEKALRNKRERRSIGVGSTSDAYIPLEKDYQLTRKCLEIIKKYNHPLVILTKSNLVLRDLDLITEINKQKHALIMFTITTADDNLAKIIEPRAPLPTERFEAMGILAAMGVNVGVAMMPILPFINDTNENMAAIVEGAIKNKAKFILPSFGVTLRDRQRDYYYSKLPQIDIDLVVKYQKRYGNYYVCNSPYYKKISTYFYDLCRKNNIDTKVHSYDYENSKLNLFNINKQS